MHQNTLNEKKNSVYVKHYKKLIGKTVESLVMDQSNAHETFFGLKFHDGTIAWILQDPEGNGPGHLDITKSKL